MRTIEAEPINDTAMTAFPASEAAAPVATTGNYEPVRFNAMKHGILSQLVVLAHEDHAEFADLLAALMDEHRPAGMTERHLIEELATIIWRKRRVLLAEGAKINEGLKSAVNSPKSVMPVGGTISARHGGREYRPARSAGLQPRKTMPRARRARRLIWLATEKAAAILRKGGPNAYDQSPAGADSRIPRLVG